jgi:phage major head subunit gpT-like protein
MIINDSNLNDIRKVTASIFGEELDKLLAVSVHNEYTDILGMTTSKLDTGWLGSVPEMKAWVGSKDVRDVNAYKHEIEPDPFESTVGVHKHKLEDAAGTPGEVARFLGLDHIARSMARKAALWYPVQTTAALTAGSTSGNNSYDGVPMFDGSHPNKHDGTTFSNEDTSGDVNPWYLIDSRGVKPILFGERERPNIRPHTTGDLMFLDGLWLIGAEGRGKAEYGEPRTTFRSTKSVTVANIRTHINTMATYVDDYGSQLAVDPDVVMYGKTLRFTFDDILNKSILATGEENDGRRLGLRGVYNPFMA